MEDLGKRASKSMKWYGFIQRIQSRAVPITEAELEELQVQHIHRGLQGSPQQQDPENPGQQVQKRGKTRPSTRRRNCLHPHQARKTGGRYELRFIQARPRRTSSRSI